MPGMYVLVNLKPAEGSKALFIPANTFITRSAGPQVAIVSKDSTIIMRDIQVGRDYGKNLQILSGLEGGENLVVNPSEKLRDGLRVRVIKSNMKQKNLNQ